MSGNILKICLFLLIVLCSFTACHATGRATGATVDTIEKGTDDFKEGYEEGRE